jgi:hypothetical protein
MDNRPDYGWLHGTGHRHTPQRSLVGSLERCHSSSSFISFRREASPT